MASFKGIFVSSLVTFIILGTVVSLYFYGQNPSHLAWLGNVLSFGTGAVYFGGIYLIATPRTSKNMWSTWIPLIVGTILVLYTSIRTSTIELPLILNLFMLLGWFLYTYWATDFSDRDKTLLQVGKPLPNVCL